MTITIHKTPACAKWALAAAATTAMAMTSPAFGQAKPAATKMTLSPPKTSLSVHLGPYDPAVEVVLGKDRGRRWFCDDDGIGLDQKAKDVDKLWAEFKIGDASDKELTYIELKFESDNILSVRNKSTFMFMKDYLFMSFIMFYDISINPRQGQKLTKTLNACYTMAELDAGKREAVRWATYMHDIWLPAHKGGK